MMEKLKNKISENSGLVNMIINLSILYLLFSVATGIKELKQSVGLVQQQTQINTLSPVLNEEELKKQILGLVIQKLQESQK